MNESILERIQSSAKALKIDLYTAELASYADEKETYAGSSGGSLRSF